MKIKILIAFALFPSIGIAQIKVSGGNNTINEGSSTTIVNNYGILPFYADMNYGYWYSWYGYLGLHKGNVLPRITFKDLMNLDHEKVEDLDQSLIRKGWRFSSGKKGGVVYEKGNPAQFIFQITYSEDENGERPSITQLGFMMSDPYINQQFRADLPKHNFKLKKMDYGGDTTTTGEYKTITRFYENSKDELVVVDISGEDNKNTFFYFYTPDKKKLKQ